jgi:hypothetical protein
LLDRFFSVSSRYFQGAGPSADIAWNATAEEVEYALQMLSSIDDVEVAVTEDYDLNTDAYGYCRPGTRCRAWAVTFIRTRRDTDYGWVIDSLGNLPPLEPDTTLLSGTDAGVDVDYLYEGAPSLDLEVAVRGDDGTRAGCAYVFVPADTVVAEPEHRSNGEIASAHAWRQQARLTAADATAFDLFGCVVCWSRV